MEFDNEYPGRQVIYPATRQWAAAMPSHTAPIRRIESIGGTVYDIRSGTLAGTITVRVIPDGTNNIWICSRTFSYFDVVGLSIHPDGYDIWAHIHLENGELWRCLLQPTLPGLSALPKSS